MPSKKKPNNLTNQFVIEVNLDFPDDMQGVNLMQWLNTQWTGKPTVPLKAKVGKEHLNASYRLHMGRRANLTLEIDKQGDWKLIKAEMA